MQKDKIPALKFSLCIKKVWQTAKTNLEKGREEQEIREKVKCLLGKKIFGQEYR